ncbi:hypothetical protein ACS0PU_006580 [Formica fusca]
MPKEIRFLSKRRKSQLIKQQLLKFKDVNNENSSQNVICNIYINSLFDDNSMSVNNDPAIIDSASQSQYQEINDVNVLFNETFLNLDYESQKSLIEIKDNNKFRYLYESNQFSIISVSSRKLTDKLRSWILKYRISHRSVNTLLAILRNCNDNLEIRDLPKNVRTLMNTPRETKYKIKYGNGGSYVHFGIENGLKRSIEKYFQSCPNIISIQFNCDGAAISLSSTSQFWSLLVAINANFHTEPFLVGLFHGYLKPTDANTFLLSFVDEMENIQENGIIIEGKKIDVVLKAIICDAPARAFITYTKYHGGYFGCSKCTQEGEWVSHVIFPETDNCLRTDESFNNMQQEEHHTGESILKRLKIGMVSDIAIDYMHLVCLGVMKRLLKIWLKGPKDIRLQQHKIDSLCTELLAIKSSIPSEFARLPRTLYIIDRWKATECRQFLLYTGLVVLKPILSKRNYTHFLALSIAIRILCNSNLCLVLNDYANSLLKWFVIQYKELYGIRYISYNVHNLIHLANEVIRFGCLDNFSCFKFENYIKNIKSKIQNSPKPLEQVSNRIHEENSLPVIKEHKKICPNVIRSKKSSEILKVEYDKFVLSSNSNDNCCLLFDSTILIVTKFFFDDSLYVSGNIIKEYKSFFHQPCNSKRLNIFIVDDTCTVEHVVIKASLIYKKCFKIPYPNQNFFVIIPLLQYNQ